MEPAMDWNRPAGQTAHPWFKLFPEEALLWFPYASLVQQKAFLHIRNCQPFPWTGSIHTVGFPNVLQSSLPGSMNFISFPKNFPFTAESIPVCTQISNFFITVGWQTPELSIHSSGVKRIFVSRPWLFSFKVAGVPRPGAIEETGWEPRSCMQPTGHQLDRPAPEHWAAINWEKMFSIQRRFYFAQFQINKVSTWDSTLIFITFIQTISLRIPNLKAVFGKFQFRCTSPENII